MAEMNGKSSPPLGSIISIIVFLVIMSGEAGMVLGIILMVGLVAGIIALPIWLIKRRQHTAGHQKQLRDTTYSGCQQEKSFDERVQALFCFHKDKAYHHVRRGKEIDPWDRPDIDISKYQRKG